MGDQEEIKEKLAKWWRVWEDGEDVEEPKRMDRIEGT
jgi:hypothetical protein